MNKFKQKVYPKEARRIEQPQQSHYHTRMTGKMLKIYFTMYYCWYYVEYSNQ